MCESLLEQVALFLGLDVEEVRARNLIEEHDGVTPYGQKVEGCHLPRMFKQLRADCDFDAR